MTLNLTTNCVEHTILKEYLEENASATLADKINRGVFIEKDGKRLLNRKDLNGFMQYACNEAKKLAAKGATSACVKSDIVFSWAIHYFEEDEIIGKLYNEDGSEYKPEAKPTPKPVQHVPAPTISIKPTPPKQQQFTLFDLIPKETQEETSQKEEFFDEKDVDLETGEILRFQPQEPKQGSLLYQKYQPPYCFLQILRYFLIHQAASGNSWEMSPIPRQERAAPNGADAHR